jgi:hypothetical protein
MKQSGIVLLKISQKFNIDLDYAEECLAAAELVWGDKPDLKQSKMEVDSRRYLRVQRQALSLMEDLKERINIDVYAKPKKIIRPKAHYTNRNYLAEYGG